jgi:hypothetical protein
MNRQEIIEQLRVQSQSTYAQAKMKKLHEATANELAYTNTAAAGGAAGGGSTPVTELTFVVNTTDHLDFNFDFTSTGEPIEFIIDWGDGTIHEDFGVGGYYEESHTYDEVGEYTVKVKFDDPRKILQIDFPGFTDDYAGISSISNLQTLSNLQEFRADYNYLVSVDLSGLTNLTYVDISDCEIPNTEGEHSLTTLDVSGCTALEELRLDDSDFSNGIPDLSGLTALRRFDMDECGIRGTVDLSGLPSLEAFDIHGNPELTRVIISSSQPLGNDDDYSGVDIYDCGLTQTAVNNILVALAANDIENGSVSLQGGTNAIPSATGLTAITTLEGRGWSVDTNTP